MADRHFNVGVDLARRGELDSAVAEFERAYAASPHFAVLYNLGQAHHLAGRPVEAADAFRRYLAEGGSAVNAARRSEVEATLHFNERRIATLEISATPASATITVDGYAFPVGERRVLLRAGRHGIVASLDGYRTEIINADLEGGQTKSVEVELDPIDAFAPGWLAVDCPVPSVLVEIDGRFVGETPIKSLVRVAAGSRRIRFSRQWYVGKEADVVVGSTPSTVRCDMRAVEPLPPDAGASLRVVGAPPSTEVWLDGLPYGGERVPTGRHRVELRKCGFNPWKGYVEMGSSRTKVLAPSLEPTPQFRKDVEERRSRQRTWAYVTGGSGIALGLAAIGLYVESTRRFEAWQSDRDSLLGEISDGAASKTERDKAAELQNEAASIQRLDDATVATAVGAGLLVAVSTVLFLTMPEAVPYAPRAARSGASPRLESLEWRF